MKSISLMTLLLLLVVLPIARFSTERSSVSEDSTQKDCPRVMVSCPDGGKEGESITVTANVSGGDPKVTPTYSWSISAGTITSGQGTSSITIDTTGLGGQTITATVEVGGYASQCPRTASCTTVVAPPAARSRMFDGYGEINLVEEHRRLDRYTVALQNEPPTQGFIIAYGGRCTPSGEGQRRADRTKEYLVNTRGVDGSRLVKVDGGLRECLEMELWIVPQGAESPALSPTVAQPGGSLCSRTAPRRCQR
jgi:hypothetical protein